MTGPLTTIGSAQPKTDVWIVCAATAATNAPRSIARKILASGPSLQMRVGRDVFTLARPETSCRNEEERRLVLLGRLWAGQCVKLLL